MKLDNTVTRYCWLLYPNFLTHHFKQLEKYFCTLIHSLQKVQIIQSFKDMMELAYYSDFNAIYIASTVEINCGIEFDAALQNALWVQI